MKGWNMFSEIKQYKTLGFNKSQVERTLNINYKTVQKYWDMTPDEYSKATIESKWGTATIHVKTGHLPYYVMF